MLGVQALSLFHCSEPIRQHILDIERPHGWWDEHTVLNSPQLLRIHIVEIQDHGMVTPENFLGPFCPVIGAGLEFFQVALECF